MWGTRTIEKARHFFGRFIPTHVGNAFSVATVWVAAAVHPHACGERFASIIKDASVDGSSPRMWGTQLHEQLQAISLRFIPTNVGNDGIDESICVAAAEHHNC